MAKGIAKLLWVVTCCTLLTGCNGVFDKFIPEQEVIEEQEKVEESKVPSISKKDTVMKLAMNAPVTLHPLYNMDKSVEQNLHLLFNTLVNIEEDGNISANIATAWELDASNQKITLQLAPDIYWHDGERLTAEDVVFTINTIMQAPESPYKKCVENIANVQATGPNSLQVSWRQPFSGSLQTLFFPIIPAHVYNVPFEEALQLTPVGSGPYQYSPSDTLKRIRLVANTNYFKGAPHIKEIDISLIPDEESILYSFEQGLIDVIYTNVMDWGKYAKDKSATIHEVATNYYEFIGFNFNKSFLQNANIRQALAYGIDREEIVTLYYLGHAIVADTPISPASYLYDHTLQTRSYDKEKARLLIAQEGYQLDENSKYFMKDGQPFTLSILVNEENKDRIKVAERIKKMYGDIGVQVVIETAQKDAYLEKIKSNQYDVFIGGWKLSYIPDLTFAFHSSQIENGSNYINYQDAQMDELLRQAFLASPQNITDAYGALQQYFVAQNPYISLYFRNGALITKNKIGGEIEPTPLNIYQNVEKWELVN